MKIISRLFSVLALSLFAATTFAAEPPLKLGVGLFQPDREKNDATYRPLAEYLSARLKRPVELRTVDSWEGLAKSLANGLPMGAMLATDEVAQGFEAGSHATTFGGDHAH